MKDIFAYLLGHPRIIMGEELISLPFKQAEALFYYLVVEKEVSRDKISDLIWGSCFDERKVKSSLRNAIYVLRKVFGADFLTEPQKNILQVNPEYRIYLDVEELEKGGLEDFRKYSGDFLENFYLKNNDSYNDWAMNRQQSYRHIYQEQLKKQICQAFGEKKLSECEEIGTRLIALDEFDELGYRYMLEIYRNRGDYSAAMSLFYRLEKLLIEELFQPPSEEIVSLVDEIKKEQSQEIKEVLSQRGSIISISENNEVPFYGRRDDLTQITGAIRRFFSGEGGVSLLISGEAGIGKTRLLRSSLSAAKIPENVLVFQTQCYHAEDKYILKPWQSIFEQLISRMDSQNDVTNVRLLRMAVSRIFPYLYEIPDQSIDQDDIATERYDSSLRAIIHRLIQNAQQQKMLLCFDDLQWADPMTVSLLRNLLTSEKNNQIMMILACRDEKQPYIESFLEDMKRNRFLKELPLKRFNFDDTIALAESILFERMSSEPLREQFYRETEGNPFFIIETANNIKYNGSIDDITPNMRNTIRLRTMQLPQETRNILDLLSFFFDGATLELLQELSNKEEYELVNILEILISRHLIREEIQSGEIVFQFTHQKIMEYVYGEISMTKRHVLHGKIAQCLEKKLKYDSSDVQLYPKLMYHFDRAGNHKKNLAYYIEYVYSYLNRLHEYYPVLTSLQTEKLWDEKTEIPSDDDESIPRILHTLEEDILQYTDMFTQRDEQTFLSDYYHMMGRYHIRKVNYDLGRPYIEKLIKCNEGIDSECCRNNMIKAYRQLICIYVNRCETQKMREVIQSAFQILAGKKPEELAIWMRLDGLCDIMTGEIERGKKTLQTAISVFEKSKEKNTYLFNLAASYAWLGEAERHCGQYSKAIEHYDHAIRICTENLLTGGISTFYTYAGQAALDSGDMEKAGFYLKQAVDQFSKVELMWGRGMAFAYYGLYCFRQGDYRQSLSMLVPADKYSHKLDSCMEMGVENRIFAQIRMKMEKDPQIASIFGDYLTQETEDYIARADHLLRTVYAPIEKKYLRDLKEQLKHDSDQEQGGNYGRNSTVEPQP